MTGVLMRLWMLYAAASHSKVNALQPRPRQVFESSGLAESPDVTYAESILEGDARA